MANKPTYEELEQKVKKLEQAESEHKHAEDELQKRKATIQSVLDAAPVGICIMENRVYKRANRYWCEHFGYPEEDLIGRTTEFLYESHEEYECVGKALYEDLLKKGIAFSRARLKRSDGEFRDVNLIAKPLNPNDLEAGTVVVVHDLTERKKATEALRETEERLRIAGKAAYDLIYEWNVPNDALEWFGDIDGLLGYESGAISRDIGAWLALIHPEDRGQLENAVELHRRATEPIHYEYRIKHRDGTYRHFRDHGLPMFDNQGRPYKWVGVCADITERKQSQVELKESEDKFRNFTEQSLVGIYLISDDVFKYVNPKFAEIFGYRVDECLDNMHFPQLVHPEDLATVQKQVSRRLSGESKVVRYSFRGIKKSGETIHVEIFGSYMVLKGETVATGTMLDITERKQVEEALRESEENYRLLVENQTDLLVKVDREGRFQFVSPSYCRMFGKTEEELLGKAFMPLVHPDDRESTAKEMLQLYHPPHTAYIEQRAMTKDGWRWLAWLDTGVLDEKGNVIEIIGLGRDISESKQAEEEKKKLVTQLQQAQKMEAIGTLAGGVAHDLNNILGGLVSYPELLLLQLPLDSPLRKSILTIQKSGEKAAAVVQDLLTLAKRGVVVTEVVKLNNVIAQYLKSPENEKLQSYHPGVHIETHLEKDTLNILGSPIHLSKTVMNLVSNAAEAMPEGGTLSISTKNRYIDKPIGEYDNVKEGDYVVLIISDSGTDISPDDINKIFEPFYTKKKMGISGTGLGMAVVWGTVKDHNGYIHVQSTEGKGTTFTLYFPVTRKSLEERSETSLEDHMGKGEAILVVDDVEGQRKIASGMLKELGYSVAMVSSGEEAVEYLKTNNADLLVLDMIMDPGMDGLDAYKKILEIHPGQKAIIASGFSETDRVKELQSLGAGTYVRKPFLLEKIGLAVKEELKKQAVLTLGSSSVPTINLRIFSDLARF